MVAHPAGEVVMGLLSGVWAWFTDPANWQGPDGVPTRVVEHLRIAGVALLLAVVIAVPVGIVLGRSGRGGFLAFSVGNVGRAIPTFALLFIFASWETVGVGDLAAMLALVLFAIPPLLTNTYVGLREVDVDVKDSALGLGMTSWQRLRRVELPLSVPLVAAGLRTTTVQVVATATLAAFVGGGGLGRYIVDGFGQQDTVLITCGVILVALLCMATEGAMALAQRAATPPPLREPSGEQRRERASAA
ncbi:MAG: ABC transporter permease [Candidatus Nanopelagicales bacterium]